MTTKQRPTSPWTGRQHRRALRVPSSAQELRRPSLRAQLHRGDSSSGARVSPWRHAFEGTDTILPTPFDSSRSAQVTSRRPQSKIPAHLLHRPTPTDSSPYPEESLVQEARSWTHKLSCAGFINLNVGRCRCSTQPVASERETTEKLQDLALVRILWL
jgi:hypothetical protein